MVDDTLREVDLDFLPEALSRDVRASLEAGVAAEAMFEDSGGPDELFRAAVRRAIKAIESKDRNDLLPRFLSVGPYFDSGPIPPDSAGRFMSDREVAAAIRFIFSSAINSFQGQLAEMLAVGPVVRLAEEIVRLAGGPGETRVLVGDTVLAHPLHRRTWAKAADLHLLEVAEGSDPASKVTVHGVVEVKSYAATPECLRPQVEQHVGRAQRGLRILGEEVAPDRVTLGGGADGPAQIVVVPSTWELPRTFRFEKDGEHTFLAVDEPEPPMIDNLVVRLDANRWLVTLRWSDEALADSAYAMTFWYMGELGRLLYEGAGVPHEWSEMTPEQAGQNAVTMMLYYAILRARTGREASRATALYNSYGFGYALGSNFVDRRGRREVLFYEDLHEILATGRSRTKPVDADHPAQRCRIRRGRDDGSDV